MSSESDLLELKLDWKKEDYLEAGLTEEFLKGVKFFGTLKRRVDSHVETMRQQLPEAFDSSAKFMANRSIIKSLFLLAGENESSTDLDPTLKWIHELQERKQNSVLHGLKMFSEAEKKIWSNHNKRLTRMFNSLHDRLFQKPMDFAIPPVEEEVEEENEEEDNNSTSTASQQPSSEIDEEIEEESEATAKKRSSDDEEEDEEEPTTTTTNANHKRTITYCGSRFSNYLDALWSDSCRVQFVQEKDLPANAKVIKMRKSTGSLLKVCGYNDEGEANGKVVFLDLRR